MFGSGVDMIIDPMNYNNLLKKLERGKGDYVYGENELDENEIQGTGLFAGSGNRSGKYQDIRKRVSGVILVMIPQEWELIPQDMDTNNLKKQQIL